MTAAGALRRSDRILLVGTTGSGKSHLARLLWSSQRPPRVVIDPKDDATLTGGVFVDGRAPVTFHDPARLPRAEVGRFVPRDPFDLDAYERLYGELWRVPGVYVWLDEAGIAAPEAGGPRALRRFITQGRARGLGHIAANQRAVNIDRQLIANAEHLVIFRMGDPDDRARMAKACGMAPADLAAELATLSKFGYCWYDGREQVVTVVARGASAAR